MVSGREQSHARLQFLDASRGLTMFFVLLSHFSSTYFVGPQEQAWRWWLVRIGMIATPTFVILSGMLLGVHYHAARSNFARIQTRLIDRGLFLILVSHLVIALPQGAWRNRVLYSTDGLGVAMILGALLVPRMRSRHRLALGLGAYAASWLAVCFWHPHVGVSGDSLAKEALFGNLVPVALDGGTFPLVPWFAVYLVSSVFGQRLAALYSRGATRRLTIEVALLGIGAAGTATCIELVAWWFGVLRGANDIVSALVWVGQKSPPAPLYLLLYCGAGMTLLGLCLLAEKRQWCPRVFRYAVVCGEASLFVYFAHFYLLWLGPHVLSPGGVARGFVFFVLSTAVLIAGAHAWQWWAFNRIFTVKYLMVRGQLARFATLTRPDAIPVLWLEPRAKS